MRAVWAQTALDLRRTLRNVRYVIFALSMPVGFYLLYSSLYGGARSFQGTTWGAYFLISMVTFGNLGTLLNVTGTQVAVERGEGWQRWLRLTPLTGAQYTLSKWLTAMLASLLVTALVTATAALQGVRLIPLHVLPAVLGVWLAGTSFAAVGLLLGQLMDAASVTYGVTLVYLGSSFLGGLWTPLAVLPTVFTRIARVLPTYRVALVGWDILAGHRVGIGTTAVLLAYVVCCGVMGGMMYARRDAARG